MMSLKRTYRSLTLVWIATLGLYACATAQSQEQEGPVHVTLEQQDGSYTLLVDGEPFYINGAGLEFGSIPELAARGGNAFRTWRTDNGQRSALEVLDEAQQYGLKVMMGIEVARERHGFDYDDPAAVAAQLEDIRQQVLALKDHPALLIWGIGNELNLRSTNPAVWDAVNDISKMIHEVDPNHLTTTSLAGIGPELVTDIRERATDLDLLCIQMYADIENLQVRLKDAAYDGPFIITEWGATGHWEVPVTDWNAPIENDSHVKAVSYQRRYERSIEPMAGKCLGSFVFLWGQKQERTPTWYGLFTPGGEATETVDVMQHIWTGNWPDNRSPILDSMRLNLQAANTYLYLQAGKSYPAAVWATDPDQDVMHYTWQVMPESTDLGDGGDFESTPHPIDGLISGQGQANITLSAPEQPGAYRLFVYIYDGHMHAAHANIPFFVR